MARGKEPGDINEETACSNIRAPPSQLRNLQFLYFSAAQLCKIDVFQVAVSGIMGTVCSFLPRTISAQLRHDKKPH